jgi:hypothetical protein
MISRGHKRRGRDKDGPGSPRACGRRRPRAAVRALSAAAVAVGFCIAAHEIDRVPNLLGKAKRVGVVGNDVSFDSISLGTADCQVSWVNANTALLLHPKLPGSNSLGEYLNVDTGRRTDSGLNQLLARAWPCSVPDNSAGDQGQDGTGFMWYCGDCSFSPMSGVALFSCTDRTPVMGRTFTARTIGRIRLAHVVGTVSPRAANSAQWTLASANESFCWLRSGEQWLGVHVDESGSTLGRVFDVRHNRATRTFRFAGSIAPANQCRLVGAAPDGNIVAVDAEQDRAVTEGIKLYLISLRPGSESIRSTFVPTPVGLGQHLTCEFAMSPDCKHIAWLTSTVKYPFGAPSLAPVFARLGIRRYRSQSVWVSDISGENVHLIGEADLAGPNVVGDLQWLPTNMALSFTYNHYLYTVQAQ